MEHIELRAKIHHKTGNWVICFDCFNGFNTVTREKHETKWRCAPGPADVFRRVLLRGAGGHNAPIERWVHKEHPLKHPCTRTMF